MEAIEIAEKTALSSDAALPHMRVLQVPPKHPVFLLEDWEIGQRQMLPSIPRLHWAMYVDDQLRIHLEINNVINTFEAPSWKDFLDPMRHYRAIAPTVIAHSFLKDERRLIGGLTATFYREDNCTIIEVIGLLPSKEIQDVPSEVRKKAFLVLGERFDEFNRVLGADFARSGYTVIPPERMEAAGWEVYKIRKFKNLLKFYWDSFPMWLRRKQRFFVRRYRDVEIEK